MNIIEVVQNTKNWREWREKGLGASDAPVIMEVSPWTTPFQLWAYKVGLLVREPFNEYQAKAMARGHELEPIVREKYERLSGSLFPATSFEHSEYSFLRASLDGWNNELNRNLEIKCPGKVDHAIAMQGKIPDKYFPQLQMQMLVSGAQDTAYVSWDGKSEDIAIVNVRPDKVYQEKLLQEMLKFWQCIQNKIPPKIYLKELGAVTKIMGYNIEQVSKSFKTLSLVCEAISKGEINDKTSK